MTIIENPSDLIDLIERDVTAFFSTAFPTLDDRDDHGFSVPERFRDAPPVSTDGTAAVPWVWRGLHRETFAEVRATGADIEVAGVTLVTDDDGRVSFIRVVDWLTLYRQLGMMMVCRRPRHTDPELHDDLRTDEELDTSDIPSSAS